MRSILLLSAAFAASGAHAATREWPLRDFQRVQLEAPADLTVTVGPRFSVQAESDQAMLDRLSATVTGDLLRIASAKHTTWLSRSGKLHIRVTMPRVAGAGLKGVGSITVDRAEAPLAVFAIDGTGSIDVGAIRADKTVLALSGTGSIEVKGGTTGHLDARRSGMGSIEAAKLAARSATLVSTGMGSLDATVDGPVSIVKSGMGSVDVHGNPRCTVRKSGMGSVDCGNGG